MPGVTSEVEKSHDYSRCDVTLGTDCQAILDRVDVALVSTHTHTDSWSCGSDERLYIHDTMSQIILIIRGLGGREKRRNLNLALHIIYFRFHIDYCTSRNSYRCPSYKNKFKSCMSSNIQLSLCNLNRCIILYVFQFSVVAFYPHHITSKCHILLMCHTFFSFFSFHV